MNLKNNTELTERPYSSKKMLRKAATEPSWSSRMILLKPLLLQMDRFLGSYVWLTWKTENLQGGAQ